jgi:hypothetical protein
MEETPEQVLARLQRYVDARNARGQSSPATNGTPTPSSVSPTAAAPGPVSAAVVTADAPHLPISLGTVSRTIAGQVLCVATCAVTILLWVNVAHVLTYVVVLGAATVCLVGLARRVPFAGWALIGLVLGLVLGRFS